MGPKFTRRGFVRLLTRSAPAVCLAVLLEPDARVWHPLEGGKTPAGSRYRSRRSEANPGAPSWCACTCVLEGPISSAVNCGGGSHTVEEPETASCRCRSLRLPATLATARWRSRSTHRALVPIGSRCGSKMRPGGRQWWRRVMTSRTCGHSPRRQYARLVRRCRKRRLRRRAHKASAPGVTRARQGWSGLVRGAHASSARARRITVNVRDGRLGPRAGTRARSPRPRPTSPARPPPGGEGCPP